MRKFLLPLLLLTSSAFAQSPTSYPGPPDPTYDYSYAVHSAAQCQITVTSTATTLSALIAAANTASAIKCPFSTIPPWATAAGIQNISASPIYYSTTSGLTLTTSVGMQIAAGQPLWPIQGTASISALSLIAPANAIIMIQFQG